MRARAQPINRMKWSKDVERCKSIAQEGETMDSTKSLLRRKLVFSACLAACISMSTLPTSAQDVTYERLLHAQENPADWLTYYGSYNGSRFSTLKQIDTSNVHRLVVKWAFQ